MDKIKIKIELWYENDISFHNQTLKFYASNLSDLKCFINNPTSFIDREEELELIRMRAYDLDTCYAVDKDGNRIEEDFDVDDEVEYKEKSQEEKDEYYKNEIEGFNDFYNKLSNGDYEFVSLECPFTNKFTIDEIKEVMMLLKDKVKTIDVSNLSLEVVTDIINTCNISDDVMLITHYNYKDSSRCSELKELFNYLSNIKKYIKRFDLSPLEICIFVNDLIREREYKDSDKQMEYKKGMTPEEYAELLDCEADSRSLLRVFKSDKIVCAGFSNLYSAILELVGIKSNNLVFYPPDGSDSKTGHMSNVVFLNDKKYNIFGAFEVDTTWGRVRNKDGSQNYQKSYNNYSHFMRSIREATESKIHKDLEIVENLSFLHARSIINRLLKFFDIGAPYFIVRNELKMLANKCNEYNKSIDYPVFKEDLDKMIDMITSIENTKQYNKEEVLKILKTVYRKMFDRTLDIEGFRDALYRVRFIEHSIDKDKYPIDNEFFQEGLESRITDRERLMNAIFGISVKNELTKKEKLGVARAELISVLHKVAKDNVDKNPVHHI